MNSLAHASGGRRARPKRGPSVVSVLGELFLTAGVICFLFIGWQLWLNDIIVGDEQRRNALEAIEQWDTPPPIAEGEQPDPEGEPPTITAPGHGIGFAAIYIPRFGPNYVRMIAEGVDLPTVLNKKELGVGHYPGTQMPGEIGNFALAGHRTTWGAPFRETATLQLGDKIYVKTPEAWYTYVYRTTEYVWPSGVGVIDPVPQVSGGTPEDRFLTITSCHPLFSAAERIIAYTVMESWQPAAAGMPEDLAAVFESES